MAKRAAPKTFEMEIIELYGFLNEEHTVCFVKVSWNGRKAKNEIRRCKEVEGELILGKGLAITDSEIRTLIGIVNGTEKPDKGSWKDPVDFNALFRAGEGIMEKREKGYRTKDGFIMLTRKDN